MSTSLPLRINRFIVVAVCATLAMVGLFFIVFFVFSDTTPPTPFEYCCTIVWAVASWPLSAVWSVLQEDPPLVVIIPLWIASGLFWAFIVELLLTVKRWVWPDTAPEPTTVDACRSAVASRRWLGFFVSRQDL